MTERHKPGEKAPHSGQYPIMDPKKGNTGVERTVTKGEPFPPTPKKGQSYCQTRPSLRLVDNLAYERIRALHAHTVDDFLDFSPSEWVESMNAFFG